MWCVIYSRIVLVNICNFWRLLLTNISLRSHKVIGKFPVAIMSQRTGIAKIKPYETLWSLLSNILAQHKCHRKKNRSVKMAANLQKINRWCCSVLLHFLLTAFLSLNPCPGRSRTLMRTANLSNGSRMMHAYYDSEADGSNTVTIPEKAGSNNSCLKF